MLGCKPLYFLVADFLNYRTTANDSQPCFVFSFCSSFSKKFQIDETAEMVFPTFINNL